jgi:predicted aspartyl protease
MKIHSLLRILSVALMGWAVLPATALGQEASSLFRRYTMRDGKTFYAMVHEKADTQVTFKLQNGRLYPVRIDALSEPDAQFVRKWTRFKEQLMKNSEFAHLTVQGLLELIGYQAIEFQIEGNHIYVDGELNNVPAKLMVDTGANSSLINLEAAQNAKLEVGPLTVPIFGVGDKPAMAGPTKVPVLKVGDAVMTNRKLLSSDLDKDIPGGFSADMLFGGDFLRELDAVISYREGRMFLKIPSAAGTDPNKPKAPPAKEFRRWTSTDGKVFSGAIEEKTETTATFRMLNGQIAAVPIDKFIEADQEVIKGWSKLRQDIAKHPELFTLTVKELLELRGYQSFEYKLIGNSIVVDGMLNKGPAKYLIDTGAHSALLHVESAKRCEVPFGPFDQLVSGIGGTAPAAIGKVDSLSLGQVTIKNREVMVSDLFKVIVRFGGEKNHDGLFGADFLRELDGVVNYKENRIFLRPDFSDNPEAGSVGTATEAKPAAPLPKEAKPAAAPK